MSGAELSLVLRATCATCDTPARSTSHGGDRRIEIVPGCACVGTWFHARWVDLDRHELVNNPLPMKRLLTVAAWDARRLDP